MAVYCVGRHRDLHWVIILQTIPAGRIAIVGNDGSVGTADRVTSVITDLLSLISPPDVVGYMPVVNLPDLPSWLWVVVIGFGVIFLLSNPVGWTIMGAGFVVGAIYFAIDISRKIT